MSPPSAPARASASALVIESQLSTLRYDSTLSMSLSLIPSSSRMLTRA